MNQSNEVINYKLYIGHDEAFSVNIPEHAIQTAVAN
jgi:hypothetical protein